MTTAPSLSFLDRLTGSICGLAIGDGMGGPVEGWSPQRIRERFHTRHASRRPPFLTYPKQVPRLLYWVTYGISPV